MAKLTAHFNYIDGIELEEWIIDSSPMSGSCDNFIEEIIANEEEVISELNSLDKEQLVKELREYGAWDEEELADHNQNLRRILWIAIGDIQERRFMED